MRFKTTLFNSQGRLPGKEKGNNPALHNTTSGLLAGNTSTKVILVVCVTDVIQYTNITKRFKKIIKKIIIIQHHHTSEK